MIQRLQNSPIHFKNNAVAQQPAQPAEPAQPAAVQAPMPSGEEIAGNGEKFDLVDTVKKAKTAVTDILKDVNLFTNTSGGVLRGLLDGTVATVAISAIGKSVKAGKDEKGLKVITEIGKNLLQDGWGAIKGSANYAKRIFTEDKAMYKHLGELISLPKKFYCDYMKNNKLLAAAGTTAGIAILAIRTIQGKMNANEKNANIDHKLAQGHV